MNKKEIIIYAIAIAIYAIYRILSKSKKPLKLYKLIGMIKGIIDLYQHREEYNLKYLIPLALILVILIITLIRLQENKRRAAHKRLKSNITDPSEQFTTLYPLIGGTKNSANHVSDVQLCTQIEQPFNIYSITVYSTYNKIRGIEISYLPLKYFGLSENEINAKKVVSRHINSNNIGIQQYKKTVIPFNKDTLIKYLKIDGQDNISKLKIVTSDDKIYYCGNKDVNGKEYIHDTNDRIIGFESTFDNKKILSLKVVYDINAQIIKKEGAIAPGK